MADDMLITVTADIVAAHVAHNSVGLSELPDLIVKVYDAFAGLSAEPSAKALALVPAVSIRSSVKPDYLVSLESGKKMKMLKRYLMTNYSMTPAEYRTKWGLPLDYPMVAPNYSEARKVLAKAIGLGRKPKAALAGVKAKSIVRTPQRKKASHLPEK